MFIFLFFLFNTPKQIIAFFYLYLSNETRVNSDLSS